MSDRARAAARSALVGLVLLGSPACQSGGDQAPARPRLTARAAPVEGAVEPDPVVFSPNNELGGDVSPDGRYLAYVSDETGNLDVWLFDHRTRSGLPLTKSGAEDYDPSFAPDGRTLVFVSRRLDAKGDLFLLDVEDDSDDPERLTGVETMDRQPVFAPDGRSVYYTGASPVGVEHVYRLRLEDRRSERISKTPGFDPHPSRDGRYLVYTAPEGEGGIPHPHLVITRLADSSTRALTRAEDGPAGFARALPPVGGRQRWAFVRFAHDDNGDGLRDAADQASLWRLELDPEALFQDQPEARRPLFPLTSGAKNELFPVGGDDFLYFTESPRSDRDVARLPPSGIFPDHGDPTRYIELAKTLLEPRQRWFAYLAALAVAPPGDRAEARAWLGVANEHLAEGRAGMAEHAFEQLVRVTRGAAVGSREREFGGIAEVELLALTRKRQLGRLRGELGRERVLRDTQRALELLTRRYADSSSVLARIELEAAEVLYDRGERLRALDALDRIEATRADQPYSVARAMLRRVELLRVAFDPNALGEAYRQIAERFPEEREIVMEAAVQTVEVHLSAARLERDGRPAWSSTEDDGSGRELDVLRRLIERSPPSPVRQTARARLAETLRAAGSPEAAAQELRALVEECEAAGDRVGAARALATFAEVEETLAAFEPALESWTRLREAYADLPGVAATAREAVTRVAMAKGDQEERQGRLAAARGSFRAALDNDPAQVRALRRYLTLSARLGRRAEVLEEARAAVGISARSPIAHYTYGLAAAWAEPPDLDLAEAEVTRALELNPQMVHGYITRGWVYENRYLDSRNLDWLEKAIKDYEVAIRLNREAVDLETEADAMLNLGNATWLLGGATNDDGNVRRAYSTYVERLQTGVPFRNPVQEALFWERLSRAAFWAEDWAMSVTSAREALRLTERPGLEPRRAQIFGNLALAYGEAGAHDESTEAFLAFASALEARELTQRLVVAKRSRAVSRVRAAEAAGEADLESALRDLEEARAVVEAGGYDAPEPPFQMARATANASRGPLGLWLDTEREVNLYWAERAYQLQGDFEVVRDIHERRLQLLAEETDDKTKMSLNGLRVHLGALVRAARDHCREGAGAECARRFEEAFALVTRWRDDSGFASDRPMVVLDEARLQAVFLETLASSSSRARALVLGASAALARRAEETATLQEVLTEVLPERARTLVEASPPEGLADLLRYVETASIGAQMDAASGAAPLLLLARLTYAEALLELATGGGLGAASPPGAPPTATDALGLGAELQSLDLELGQRRRWASAFVRAARWAAQVGGPVAARLHVSALEAASDVLGRGQEAVARVARKELGPLRAVEAKLLAAARGPWGGLAPGPALLGEVAALAGPEGEQAIRLLLVRSASVALARGEMTEAFELVDRQLLLAATGGRLARHARPAQSRDRALVGRYRSILGALEREERASSAPGSRAPDGPRLEALEALAQLRDTPISEATVLRLFAEPIGAEDVRASMGPDELLLTIGEVGGLLQVFLVDGSTTAASPFLHLATELSLEAARSAVVSIRSALLEGRRPPAALVAELDARLFAPLAARLPAGRKVILADALLGAPLPAAQMPTLRGRPLSHVSAPSVLAAARSVYLVGALPDLSLGGPAEGAPLLSEVSLRLDPASSLGFRELTRLRSAERAAPPTPGESRRVDARPPADRLAGAPHRLVVVEAPFQPARVPERGRIVLSARGPALAARLDRDRQTLALGELELPSRVLVLAETELAAPGPAEPPALAPLDLAAINLGTASVLLMPAVLDRGVRARILERFRSELDRLGASRALALALEPELDAHPPVALISLLGAPGLDEPAALELARRTVGSADRQSTNAAKAGDLRTAAEAAKQVVRLQTFLGAEAAVEKAQRAAVIFLVQSGSHAEAAERQKAWIERTAETASADKTAANWLLLGQVYSLARDYEAAEGALARAIEMLTEAKKPAALAAAMVERAENFSRWLRFDRAAESFEAAIRVFERAGAYGKGTVPAAALTVLRSAAQLYLNKLSEPERARQKYERYLRHAERADEKVATTLSLAQVARKLGEFDRAAALAEEARRGAAGIQRSDLELEALTEATNVSWYQGDYARGLLQCGEGLSLAESNLKKVLADKAKKSRREIRGLIYTLSVCGLLHMSTRDFEPARRTLERAAALARRNDIPEEEAAQYNNLGRVYLEFGHLDRAKEAFSKAKVIDERLSDRFALGYDYRNLGSALFLQGQLPEARQALEQATELSRSVNDPNNVLRATFALAELARAEQRDEEARALYATARELAERLSVRELAWQIHRALGLIEVRAGRAAEAEAELRRAIEIVRSLTGRSAGTSDTGPHRYQPFDDLIALLLEGGRAEEAFSLSELARTLAETETLEDRRVPVTPAEAAAFVRLRQARTATAAELDRAELARTLPRLAARFEPAMVSRISPRVPEDARILSYRLTERELIVFLIGPQGLSVSRVPIEATALRREVAELMAGLRDRSEVKGSLAALSAALLAPVAPQLLGVSRLVFVPHGPLRYVPFAALPDPRPDAKAQPLVEAFLVVSALDANHAATWLSRGSAWAGPAAITAVGAGLAGAKERLGPLVFAEKEVELIREEFPWAQVLRDERAHRAGLRSALGQGGAVVHFAGHGRLDDRDPLAGQLVTADGPLFVHEVLGLSVRSPLVVLSACETGLAARSDLVANLGGAEDWLSAAQAFQLAGAELVLASTFRVNDLAAALVMKRFYRELRARDPARALQEAQRSARRYEPHPGWWATFTLMVR